MSFTETDEEISLIMEDDYLNELLEYNDVGLEIEPTTWRALQLMVGTAGESMLACCCCCCCCCCGLTNY